MSTSIAKGGKTTLTELMGHVYLNMYSVCSLTNWVSVVRFLERCCITVEILTIEPILHYENNLIQVAQVSKVKSTRSSQNHNELNVI